MSYFTYYVFYVCLFWSLVSGRLTLCVPWLLSLNLIHSFIQTKQMLKLNWKSFSWADSLTGPLPRLFDGITTWSTCWLVNALPVLRIYLFIYWIETGIIMTTKTAYCNCNDSEISLPTRPTWFGLWGQCLVSCVLIFTSLINDRGWVTQIIFKSQNSSSVRRIFTGHLINALDRLPLQNINFALLFSFRRVLHNADVCQSQS